ncbi:hypothetical protein Pmar_PMAR018297 [Perkinsus marinus ATCC 50983]|uniref:ELM2 domain-containing protein n=1 Tax=Perkinsus marinus (strain ATCC 50983 / TXsc) TaxID=423536 RepID=C5LVQ7_PERM5|nr:hypothetical protein Pmar_PMAR018297 [Perkinsus marinus ATCC 50983]EEQ99180.1 hypothetical protein Pmar_PMAR018297 [Perkinsus marinus ATCC 50983]|eukprot:XP_002766463.1 hypothetical protein Pmar_PMAR018297 [Perkinsus marinus ATCC 50983]
MAPTFSMLLYRMLEQLLTQLEAQEDICGLPAWIHEKRSEYEVVLEPFDSPLNLGGVVGIFYSCGRCRKKRQEAYRLATTGNKSVPVGPEYQAPEIPKLWCQSFGGWKRGHPVEQSKCVWNPKLAEANGLTTDDIDEFLEKAEDVWPTQAFVHIERGARRGSNVEEEIDNGSRRSR